MNIKQYESYFHEGTIVIIKQADNIIEIWMESSEILSDENVNIPLSKTNRISGKLILGEIKKIIKDDVFINEVKQNFDYAGILELSIQNDKVELSMELYKNNEKREIMNYENLLIHTSKIEWENIPDLLDSF